MKKTNLVLLTALLLLVGPTLVRAREVVIFVSGPWIYAQDPDAADRVVVLVPVSDTHFPPQIFPGGDYGHPGGKPTLYEGFYNLDLPDRTGETCTSTGKPYQLKGLGIPVDPNAVNAEIRDHASARRIAISLPQPACYISAATSESMVGPDSNQLTKGEYTTLMALHYFVKDGPAHLSGTSDDKTVKLNDDIAFVVTSTLKPAITVAMMAVDKNSERKCDSYSHDSLNNSRLSIGLEGKLFVEFPELKDDGMGQIKGQYNKCSKVNMDRNKERMQAAIEILENVQKIRSYIADPKLTSANPEKSLDEVKENVSIFFGKALPTVVASEIKTAENMIESSENSHHEKGEKPRLRSDSSDLILLRTTGIVWPFTVGGGDCHMAQIGIGSIIP